METLQRVLNENFIETYCKDFARIVTEKIFSEENTVITGNEILSVTPFYQVNLFVVKLLFRFWEEEVQKIKSPFFDYQHKEVKEALEYFANILSQHIEIRKKEFQILLNYAAKDALTLIASPAIYLKKEFEEKNVTKVDKENIEDVLKYVDLYKDEIKNFLSKFDGSAIEVFYNKLSEEFLHHEDLESLEKALEQLSVIKQVQIKNIFMDDFELENLPETELFLSPENDGNDTEQEKGEQEIAENSFEEKTISNHASNDTLNFSVTISPEDKEVFINNLFNNDNSVFEEAIKRVEQLPSFDESARFLVNNYSQTYDWDMDSNEVKSFLKVIYRNFK